MKIKRFLIAGIALVLILIGGVMLFFNLSTFPGKITKTEFAVTTEGVKSTFHQGRVYRYPGLVPMLEVTGDHYEMGLQYGVLLKPEILAVLKSYDAILRWQAQSMGIPYPLFTAVIKFKAKQISSRIPERFHEEIQGISDGSGVPFDTILTISLLYDIDGAMKCSGLLMKAKDGTIIHGRNQDATSFGGEEVAKLAVIVKYNPEGYHSVTQQDFLLFTGVDTGYNDQGLSFSEETLPIKKANPKGNSMVYFTRMVLEECSGLEEVEALFDKYPLIGGYGMVWSDRDKGDGFVAEVVGKNWSILDMNGPLLWNFNQIYGSEMKQYQAPHAEIIGDYREEIAAIFPLKSTYEVEDAIDFLRSRTGPEEDYSWSGSRNTICNYQTQMMIIFDPNQNGFYYALGTYFGGLNKVYHISDDFSQEPVLFKEAIPLEPIVEESAKIENMLISKKEKLEKYIDLANRYPNDANAQFKVAYESLRLGKIEFFSKYAELSYMLNPELTEYKLYAGMAAYQQKLYDQAIALLAELDSSQLKPEQELYRLTILERILADTEPKTSAILKRQREDLISTYEGEGYYKKVIIPNIKLLEGK